MMSTSALRPRFEARFPTEDSCLEHVMRIRFGDRHDCTQCGRNAHYYRVRTRRSYACEYCGHQLYPTAGTPFSRTRVPLRDWFMVMTLLCYENEAVSVELVESRLGITHKTAQRLCQIIDGHLRTLAAPDGPGPR